MRTAAGDWRRRFDLCFPALKIIIEYDGQHHRTDAVQWNSDILRREQLEREGWTLIIITSQALYREPAETLARIRTVLAERGMPGLPPRTAAAWHRHFPGRTNGRVG